MKKFLLLPALLLAACAPTAAPVGPLAPGDVLTMTGTTKSKETVSITFTVRDRGQRDRDGDWKYNADGVRPASARIDVDKDQEYVGLMDAADILTSARPEDAKVLGCFATVSDPGWRTARGYLLQENQAGLQELAEKFEGSNDLTGLQAVMERAGDCQITRR